MRLRELVRLLPYYWWHQSQYDDTIERLEEIVSKVVSGQELTPEDRLFLFGDESTPYEAPVYARYLAPVAHQMDELDAALEEVRRSRDLDWAWGWVLDLLAGNVGVKRPRNFYSPGPLDDPWLRELVRLFVFCHQSRGTRDDILLASAWFLGIAWRNANWRTEILPYISLRENWKTSMANTKEPLYVEIHLPWRFVALYAGDHIYVADTREQPQGQGFWAEDVERGVDVGILDGHHLLTDFLTFVRHIVPAGVRVEVFGTGFYVADTSSSPEGEGFWIPDPVNGLDVGRMPGLLEDGAIEPVHPRDAEQLRIAPYAYGAVQKELVNWKIRYRDGQYTA
jgi:hypothetical protein